ncbi:MAG: FtsX-like permease family protein [Tunicatimonas sp.]|uniref:ABC transporter permease n=1 Tax=Tunicatimonas sp. TaxID=1940096 RepID=UPI003C7274DD
MFGKYFTTAYRSLTKHKFYSFINLLGLAIGTASCLLILHYVRYELSYEDFHEKSNQIYRLTLDVYEDGELQVQDAEVYPLAGPELKENMPEVLDFVRLHDQEYLVFGTDTYRQTERRAYYADPSVFSIFSLNMVQGDTVSALDEPFEIVLTESKAIQYFGTTDVVGKTLDWFGGTYGPNDGGKMVKITGVMEDLPSNTHLKIDFLISYTSLRDKAIGYPIGWNANNEFTYLLMEPQTNLVAFSEKMDRFVESFKSAEGFNDSEERFVVQPMADIHLYSNKTYEPEANGNADTVAFLSVIALFILVIAWVNYVNLSTARSVERAKEVGVKKAVGCSRGQLIRQFLLEAWLTNTVAMLMAIFLVYISFSAFRQLSGQPLTINLFSDPDFIIIMIGLTLGGTLLSGLYPALILSSFRPVAVMKGKLQNTTHGRWLRQGLVVFQFLASVVLMVGTFTVYQQLTFMRQQELGMNMDQVLVVNVPLDIQVDSVASSRIGTLQQGWENLSTVASVGSASSVPGTGYSFLNSNQGVRRMGSEDGGNITFYWYRADANYMNTLDMQLVAGRNFREGLRNERQIIVNEEAVRLMGFEDAESAVGQITTFYDSAEIIGVAQNYHHLSVKEPIIPLMYMHGSSNLYQYLRLTTDDLPQTIERVEANYQEVFPNSNFSYFFLDDTFDQQYLAETRFGQVFGVFAGLAILVACLGLLGLSSYTSIQRTKEIGIRKALGASVSHIILLLTKSYFQLILIALVVAVPVANYIMGEWLEQFAYRIDIHWWLFIIPGLLVIFIAIFAVSGQTLKSARSNPVEALRYE